MQCLDILSSHLLSNNWRKQFVMKLSSRGFWLWCLSQIYDVRLCGNEKQISDYMKENIILNNIHNYCSYKLSKYIHLSNCVTRTMSEWPMKLCSQKEEGDHTNLNHFLFLLCMHCSTTLPSFLSCFLSWLLLLYIFREVLRPQHFYNIFTTNHGWLVIIGSNLNLALRILF